MKKKANTIWLVLGLLAVGAAVLDQLRQPPERRTWNGSIVGLIPYDFRLPTPERIRDKVWNKETSRIIMPHIFGVGWSLNLYPIVHPEAFQITE